MMIDFKAFKEIHQKAPVEEYPNQVLEAVPEPVVSVQVSTYQHADFIRDCLDGILVQETDFPVEILIGEDESSDGTREICKAYADRHPDKIRLFLHRRENNIAIHGRPTGRFQTTYTRFKCRGTYIALCEGDDYWTDPLKLQKQVVFLEGHPECSYCDHPAIYRYEEEPNRVDTLVSAEWAATATIVARNIFSDVPKVMLDIIHGDRFFKKLLETKGKRCRVEDIEPSVYRIHEGGIHGPREKSEKQFEVFRSNIIMLSHFRGTAQEHEIAKDAIEFLRLSLISSHVSNATVKMKKAFPYLLREKLLVYAMWYIAKFEIARNMNVSTRRFLKSLFRGDR